MKSFVLRLEEGLHERLRLEAESSRRSMQACALLALEEFLGKEGGAVKPVDKSVKVSAQETGWSGGLSREDQVKRSKGKK